MREYRLEINDVEYPWSSLYWKRSAPFVDDPITAVIPMKQSVTGEDKIEILEDGVVKTTGRLHSFGYSKGSDGVFTTIRGSTLERDAVETSVQQRIWDAQPNVFIQNNINLIATIKAVPRLTAGTINAYGSNLNVEFGGDYENRWKNRDAWERFCQITGWEIYVSPLGAVDFKASCGVDRGITPAVSTTKFQSGENILRWTRPHLEDHSTIAGTVKVVGRREGVYQAYGISGAAEPVRHIYMKDLHNMDVCVLAASAIDADMGNPVVTGAFQYIDEGLTYDVYDTVQIVDEDFGINGDYRIYEYEKWVTPEAAYGALVYTTLTNMTGNAPILIDRGTGYLKKGQEALKQVSRTPSGLRDEVRLFKYNGEDVTGYSQTTFGTGIILVQKDYGMLRTGVGAGQSILESIDNVMNFENEISVDINFYINNLADPTPDRLVWMGTWDSVNSKGIYFYLNGFDLDAVCYNGVAAATSLDIMDPIATDTWYRLCAFKRNNIVYVYLNSTYIGSISTNVPTTGLTTTLYIQQYAIPNAGARNFAIYWDQFELTGRNVPDF